MNGGKLVIWLKTDVGSELPLISFDVTHPGLVHPDIRDTEMEESETT